MPPSNSASLSLAEAQTLLKQFTCRDRDPLATLPDAATVRQALHQVVEHSDYQIFGVCGESFEQAIAALTAYLTALGYAVATPEPIDAKGPTYIKYNQKTGLCYAAPYLGEHRGVLVSCQSTYDGEVNETFGHLPLDLFEA
jgi:hypothetical protein